MGECRERERRGVLPIPGHDLNTLSLALQVHLLWKVHQFLEWDIPAYATLVLSVYLLSIKVNCFNTFTIVLPTVASTPISEGPILCPDINTTSSFPMSHPWKKKIVN